MTNEKPVLAYPIPDACAVIGCGRTKLYDLIGTGKLDARSLGARTVILAPSLEKFVADLPPAPIRGVQQNSEQPKAAPQKRARRANRPRDENHDRK